MSFHRVCGGLRRRTRAGTRKTNSLSGSKGLTLVFVPFAHLCAEETRLRDRRRYQPCDVGAHPPLRCAPTVWMSFS